MIAPTPGSHIFLIARLRDKVDAGVDLRQRQFDFDLAERNDSIESFVNLAAR